MGALAANRTTQRKDGALQALPVGVDIIYRGALTCVDTSGYLLAGQDTAGYTFGGVAYEKADNSAGTAGDIECRVYRSGVFEFVAAGMAITDVGKKVYIADDQTVQLAQPGGGNVFCGVIVDYVSATSVFVDIGPACAPTPANIQVLTGSLTAVTGTTAGGIMSKANPFGETVVILDLILAVATPATGSATGDFGVAANGTTSSDTLMDDVDIGAAEICADTVTNKGTNGKRGRTWDSTEYVTGTASATLAGLVGVYYIICLLPTAR